jgi:hypothetical protein
VCLKGRLVEPNDFVPLYGPPGKIWEDRMLAAPNFSNSDPSNILHKFFKRWNTGLGFLSLLQLTDSNKGVCMKKMGLIVALVFSTGALATEKICFQKKDDSGKSNSRFTAVISTKKLVIKNATKDSEAPENGTFSREKSADVNGRDGKTYLAYPVSHIEGTTYALTSSICIRSGL